MNWLRNANGTWNLNASGNWVLADASTQAGSSACCCNDGGCCPDTITLPPSVDPTLGTPLKATVIAPSTYVTGGCTYNLSIGDVINLDGTSPGFWTSAAATDDNGAGKGLANLSFTCSVDTFVLQFSDIGPACPVDPNLLTGDLTFQLISTVCDPFASIHRYSFHNDIVGTGSAPNCKCNDFDGPGGPHGTLSFKIEVR